MQSSRVVDERNSIGRREMKSMKKYTCSICGYVYDESVGDPDNGIAPGTKWKDVPENWVCPECGASKDQFVIE